MASFTRVILLLLQALHELYWDCSWLYTVFTGPNYAQYPALLRLHSLQVNQNMAWFRLQCVQHSIHCTTHSVHCTTQTLHCTVHRAQCAVCKVYSVLVLVNCAQHTKLCFCCTVHSDSKYKTLKTKKTLLMQSSAVQCITLHCSEGKCRVVY